MFVQPGAKINSVYYFNHAHQEGLLPDVCLCVCARVCPSHAGNVLKQLQGSSCFFAYGIPQLVLRCCRKINVSPKIREFLSETLSKTLDSGKFCHDTATIDECDINSDCWQTCLASTVYVIVRPLSTVEYTSVASVFHTVI